MLERLRPIIEIVVFIAVLSASISEIHRKRYGGVVAAIAAGGLVFYISYHPEILLNIGEILATWLNEILGEVANTNIEDVKL